MIDREAMLHAAMTLPPDERSELVKDIWDSLAAEADGVRLSEAQEAELERCWQAYLANPKAGNDWGDLLRSRSG